MVRQQKKVGEIYILLPDNFLLLMSSDGAAALVLVSGAKATELGLQVIAKIRGYADAAQVCNDHMFCVLFS